MDSLPGLRETYIHLDSNFSDTDTSIIWTLSPAPSVCILKRLDCSSVYFLYQTNNRAAYASGLGKLWIIEEANCPYNWYIFPVAAYKSCDSRKPWLI